MTFPGAGAQVYYNEAGEPTGWDYPSYDEGPDPDDFDEGGDSDWVICGKCGDEFEGDSPEKAQHTRETGHDRWS